ncbi:MAG: response regulator [Deltaproteobacteria bacterium]|jgi:PAS domain S-box-containing protein|nr:response regulator [Deltaproteobacteria bacterium]
MGHILLIIDDSEVVRTEVWAALQPTALFETCLEASDGIEGYRLLLNNPVSLVVCDVVMPGADGYKFLLLKRKADQEKQEVPVLMLTSQSSVDTVVQTMNAGANDHVTKPFRPGELVARVKTHLELYQNRQALEQARLRVSASKVFLENVLSSMADGLIVLNENEVVKRINDAMLGLLGGDSADYVGRPLREMVATDDLIHLTGIESALQDHTVSGMTVSLISVSGERIPAAVSAANLSSLGGEDDGGFVLLVRDMRESFRVAEQESRAVAAVRERTMELEEARDEMRRDTDVELKHARNLIVHAERLSALGQMVAGVGHEIVNPIWMVQAAGENLNKELNSLQDELFSILDDSSEAKQIRNSFDKRLGRMEESFEQNKTAVARLTEISEALRNHLQQVPPAMPDVDVNNLIRECMTLTQATLELNEVTTHFNEVPTLCCYRSRVGQSVTAILFNAAEVLQQKHQRALAGGTNFVGKISIETLAEERDGRLGVVVAISDNGDGIAEEMRESVFEEFFSTKPAGAGAGLGLTIARRMVHEHNGSLVVLDDKELGGARFELWLPVGGGSAGRTLED